MNRVDKAIRDADDAVTKVTKAAHTPGAERAGREIATRFRQHLRFLPASTDDTLAEIIDKETGAPEMLEALEYAASFIRVESKIAGYGDATLEKVEAAIHKARDLK